MDPFAMSPDDVRAHAEDGVEHLWLPEPPSSNRYWRMVKGRMLVSREAKNYKLAVYGACIAKRIKAVKKPHTVRIEIIWHRARKSGDLDNRVKICIDSLRGILYDDDSQIVEINARRYEGNSLNRGKVIVSVLPGFNDNQE